MTYSNTQTQFLPDSQNVTDSGEKGVPPILVIWHALPFPCRLLRLIVHSWSQHLSFSSSLPELSTFRWTWSTSPTTGVIFINCTYWKLILLFWQFLIFQIWASTSPASEPLMESGRSSLKHASGEFQHVTSSVFFGWLTDKALSWTDADH